MEHNKKFKLVSSKKTRYLLPNILTLGGVCLGISSIKFSIDGNFSLAVTLILLAAILDALDGRVARLIKGTSEFGKELDSLTDFVSFGIAPVLILYFWDLNTYGKLGWAIALVYSVCCVLRLARFNLTKIDNQQVWKNNFFEGIPSPAGGVLVLSPLIYESSGFDILNLNYQLVTPIVFITISILLISKIPTYSFKKIVVPRSTTIFLLFGVVLLFGLLLIFPFKALVIGCVFYLFLIPVSILHFLKLKKGFKNENKLNDQEPEDVL